MRELYKIVREGSSEESYKNMKIRLVVLVVLTIVISYTSYWLANGYTLKGFTKTFKENIPLYTGIAWFIPFMLTGVETVIRHFLLKAKGLKAVTTEKLDEIEWGYFIVNLFIIIGIMERVTYIVLGKSETSLGINLILLLSLAVLMETGRVRIKELEEVRMERGMKEGNYT